MSAGDDAPPEAPRSDNGSQLDSWKEIAAYFKRDVRTVRRWEASEGLPVHRHLHNERGSVYALRNELDAWWSSGRHKKAEPAETTKLAPRRRFWPVLTIICALAAVGLYFLFMTAINPTGTSANRLRVVVLPFESPKGDATEEPLGDMFAGDLTSKLGRLGPERLAVVAYTSATFYRSAGKRAVEIGRELRADFLVEGSLQRANDQLLVTVRLAETHDETLLRVWEYKRPSGTLAGLADEVAEAVAKAIGVTPTRRDSLARGRPVDPEAYQLYLRASYRMNRRSGGRQLVQKYLEEAIVREPDFAAAHAALGDLFSRNARMDGPDTQADNYAKADASVRRALALDETLPAAHTVLAGIRLFRDWDWEGARTEYRRAIELEPSDPYVRTGYAVYLRAAGRIEEALVERLRALDSDPLSVSLLMFLGTDYQFARRYDDSIRELQRALDLEPDFKPAIRMLADAYALKGLDDQAAFQTIRFLTLQGATERAMEFERVYKAQGYKAAERWLDQKNLEQFSLRPADNLWNLAYTYARLGDKEAAFRYLAAACEARDSGLLQIRLDPDVDSLRSDPRFQDLLRRIGPER